MPEEEISVHSKGKTDHTYDRYDNQCIQHAPISLPDSPRSYRQNDYLDMIRYAPYLMVILRRTLRGNDCD